MTFTSYELTLLRSLLEDKAVGSALSQINANLPEKANNTEQLVALVYEKLQLQRDDWQPPFLHAKEYYVFAEKVAREFKAFVAKNSSITTLDDVPKAFIAYAEVNTVTQTTPPSISIVKKQRTSEEPYPFTIVDFLQDDRVAQSIIYYALAQTDHSYYDTDLDDVKKMMAMQVRNFCAEKNVQEADYALWQKVADDAVTELAQSRKANKSSTSHIELKDRLVSIYLEKIKSLLTQSYNADSINNPYDEGR